MFTFLSYAPAFIFIQKHENKSNIRMIRQHNLCVYTLSTPFLIWAAFHYGVTFEWHGAGCHSHVLRFPLISSTNHNNDCFSPSVCIIVAGCHTRVLTFAMLSAGLCKYKHIFLSYWPLSPHFLDSLLQLLTIQTLWMKHNLSIQSTLSCFLSPPTLHPSLISVPLCLALLAICLNKTGQTMVVLISLIFLSLQISGDNIIRAIQWLLFTLRYTDISTIQYSFDMLTLGQSVVSLFACLLYWFHHISYLPKARCSSLCPFQQLLEKYTHLEHKKKGNIHFLKAVIPKLHLVKDKWDK